jgi:hypothetical protein
MKAEKKTILPVDIAIKEIRELQELGRKRELLLSELEIGIYLKKNENCQYLLRLEKNDGTFVFYPCKDENELRDLKHSQLPRWIQDSKIRVFRGPKAGIE